MTDSRLSIREPEVKGSTTTRGQLIVICYGCAGSRTELDGRTHCRRCGGSGIGPEPELVAQSAGGLVAASPPAKPPESSFPLISSKKEQDSNVKSTSAADVRRLWRVGFGADLSWHLPGQPSRVHPRHLFGLQRFGGDEVSLPAALDMRLVPHAPICPDCGSDDVGTEQVDVGDDVEETAYICQACGAAWPLVCVCEWSARHARG